MKGRQPELDFLRSLAVIAVLLGHAFLTGVGVLCHWSSCGFWFAVSLYLLLSLVIGVALAKLIEIPVLSFRDRFFPSRGSSAIAETVEISVPTLPN